MNEPKKCEHALKAHKFLDAYLKLVKKYRVDFVFTNADDLEINLIHGNGLSDELRLRQIAFHFLNRIKLD